MQTRPLELFPNTGHHYVFLAFGKNPKGPFPAEKVPPSILKKCNENKDSWQVYEELLPNGTVQPLEWIRWRYGRRGGSTKSEDLEFGIWVAVETNLGSIRRSRIVRPERPITKRPATERDYQTPYVGEVEKDLPLSDDLRPYPFFVPLVTEDDEEDAVEAEDDNVLGTIVPPPAINMPAPASSIPAPAAPPRAPANLGSPAKAKLPVMDDLMPKPPMPPEGYVCIEQLVLRWARESAEDPIDVEVVVDLGNSRTTVLLLELPQANTAAEPPPLRDLVSAVHFLPRGQLYQRPDDQEMDPSSIIDSWFLLHQTMFADFLPPPTANVEQQATEYVVKETPAQKGVFGSSPRQVNVVANVKRVPQMFVESAPCILGEEATDILSSVKFEHGGIVSMSSPKRYTWDLDLAQPEEWGMVPNRWATSVNPWETPSLASYVLMYLHERPTPDDSLEEDWPLEKPPCDAKDAGAHPDWEPDKPMYPRSDAIVWVALALLENAYRQLCSHGHRSQRRVRIPRRLSSVSVTFPPGWTGKELRIYRRKWKTALNIFRLLHFENPAAEKIELFTEVDEGFASQLPFVFGEMERMGAIGENWLALVGRPTENNQVAVRMMTVDIGGGTTDFSVVEYRDKKVGIGVDLDCKLLYRDSSTTAGDVMLKEIIEEMLLPKLAAIAGYNAEHQKRDFKEFFSRTRVAGPVLEEWKRTVKSTLIPMAHYWLARWGQVDEQGERMPPSPDCVQAVLPVELKMLNDRAREARLRNEIVQPNAKVYYTDEELDGMVRKTFRTLFESMAKVVALFGVDVVVITGKPSELPGVRQLIEEMIPLPPCRILSAKNHPIGDWYPFNRHGEIYDAKTVTACGAALFRALRRGLIPRWHGINLEHSPYLIRNNCWMEVVEPGTPVKFRKTYLDNNPKKLQRETDPAGRGLSIGEGTRIGRALLPSQSNAEPVYILRWKDPTWRTKYGRPEIRVWLAREESKKPARRGETPEPEYLVLKKASAEFVINEDGHDKTITVTEEDLELKLCTLPSGKHWLDDPGFSIKWPTQAAKPPPPVTAAKGTKSADFSIDDY